MKSQRRIIVSPVIGLSLIVIGALFLFGRVLNIGTLWPLFVLVPGLLCLYFAVSNGRSGAPLAIPGAIISGTGALLLYQSVTGNWQSWAYAWTLYPAFLGGGMVLMGNLSRNDQPRKAGRRLIIGGLAAFAFFGLLFESTIFNRLFAGVGWPVILIALGVFLVMRGARAPRSTQTWTPAPTLPPTPKAKRIALDDLPGPFEPLRPAEPVEVKNPDGGSGQS